MLFQHAIYDQSGDPKDLAKSLALWSYEESKTNNFKQVTKNYEAAYKFFKKYDKKIKFISKFVKDMSTADPRHILSLYNWKKRYLSENRKEANMIAHEFKNGISDPVWYLR